MENKATLEYSGKIPFVEMKSSKLNNYLAKNDECTIQLHNQWHEASFMQESKKCEQWVSLTISIF